MVNFYEWDVIPSILKSFKVKQIVLSGVNDERLINEISKSSVIITSLNLSESIGDFKNINEPPLQALKQISNYDAIFIDDEPNWYTIFNELEIINKTNDEFPLVFICNNKFPHKYRDSYLNPDDIPDNFRKEYSEELPICYNNKQIIIYDGYYHALEENTPQNGVSVAINDFLKINSNINVMDISFTDDLTILYPISTISQIRIDNFKRENSDKLLTDVDFFDELNQNKLLFSYINQYNLSRENNKLISQLESNIIEKDNLINEFNHKIQTYDNIIKYKESQIDDINSKISLKDSQIKNYESILFNKETDLINLQENFNSSKEEISSLKYNLNKEKLYFRDNEANFDIKIDILNAEISSLKKKEEELNNEIKILNKKSCDEIKKKDEELNNKLSEKNKTVNDLSSQVLFADNKINSLKNDLINSEKKLDCLKQEYIFQSSKLSSKEYCISCYKDELSNNEFELEYLKNNSVTKKIISPFSYLYLIFISKPKELSINFKLFRALKNSKCFNIGFYLKNYPDIAKSKWCKYFSPELHYVCKGFYENREFNKKYYNANSKVELLNCILNSIDE